MTRINPEAERQRLSETYAKLTDEELDKLVDDANELTDIARAALKAEIESRGGHVEFEEIPGDEEPAHPQLVTIALLRDLDEAMFARGRLASAGIESFIADENLVSMNWFMSNVIGNLRLQVREGDAESAKEILAEPIPEKFDLPDDDQQFEQPKCPKCNSLDIQFEGLHRGVGLATAWLVSLPLPLRRDAWKCNHCGAEWQEVEEASEADEQEQTFDS